MVETGVLPTGRIVAIAAFVTAAASVGVVFGVTTEAGGRRVREPVVCMTVETGRLLVLSDQRKPGRVMIELDIFPVRRGVTITANRAHRFAVRIVVPMTGIAVRGCVTVFR